MRFILYDDVTTPSGEAYDRDRKVVFNVADAQLRNPPQASGDPFEGPTDDCSNSAYHCMSTALFVVIPKGTITQKWSFEGISCRSRAEAATSSEDPDAYRIWCKPDESEVVVEFVYSRRRGITSYTRHCSNCHGQRHVLVGERGLFAED